MPMDEDRLHPKAQARRVGISAYIGIDFFPG